jgi:hypothetical protein
MLTRDCLPICVLVSNSTYHVKQIEYRMRHTRKQHQFGCPVDVVSWEISSFYQDIHIGRFGGEPVVRGTVSGLSTEEQAQAGFFRGCR